MGGKWGTFKRKRKRLEQTGFEGVETVSLSHLAEPNEAMPTKNDLYPDHDWLVYASITTWWSNFTLGWLPAIIGGPALAFFDLFQDLLSITHARYAYRYARSHDSTLRFAGPPQTPTGHDLLTNSQEWHGPRFTRTETLLLQDLYSHNYLSPEHLDAPFGKTAMTLREWIESDRAGHGELKPFTEILTEWTPPADRLFELRETLFRAGRLYYHRFFKELDYDRVVLPSGVVPRDDLWRNNIKLEGVAQYPPEPFYRADILAPWESPEPIPEIFQADFYDRLSKDPDRALSG